MRNRARPWFKFHAVDWQTDEGLRCCSLAARGLWIEMIAIMHAAEPYGHLVRKDRPMTPSMLATLVAAPERDVQKLLVELEGNDVFSRTEAGVIFSRRMVRDHDKYLKDQENGRLGGNPVVKGGVNPPVNGGVGDGLTLDIRNKSREVREEHTPLNPPLAGGEPSLSLVECLPVAGNVPAVGVKRSMQRSKGVTKRGADDDPDFARFWAEYPRKVGKGQARKAWAAATGRFPPSEVLEGLRRAKWPSDARYIPHPSTWLNGERWADQEPDNSLEARLDRVMHTPTLEIDWDNFHDAD